MAFERARGLLGQGARLAAQPAEQVLRERHDVLGALTDGRQQDREHLQPEVEVLAEATRADLGPQVPVGGGDDPNIDRDLALLADRPDGLALERAQELGLALEGQLGELVDEERALVGLAKQAPRGPRWRP